MTNTRQHITWLVAILCFYLLAQLFQQYVLRLGPMSIVETTEQEILYGQHPLNILRLTLVLLSMFAMVPGYLILTRSFNDVSPLLSTVSFVFFALFIFLEIGYRSIELFHFVIAQGHVFAQASPEVRAEMVPQFLAFKDWVSAVYFPLLLSHLLASLFLLFAAIGSKTGLLIVVAMAINGVRLVLRLSEFTPFDINIFSGPWYFPPVAVVLIMMIVWAWRRKARQSN